MSKHFLGHMEIFSRFRCLINTASSAFKVVDHKGAADPYCGASRHQQGVLFRKRVRRNVSVAADGDNSYANLNQFTFIVAKYRGCKNKLVCQL